MSIRKKKMLKSTILLVLLGILYGIYSFITTPDFPAEADNSPASVDSEFLEVIMLDVGQGDALLILCEGYTLMTDTGRNKTSKDVVNTLKELGIEKIDILIGTHPHEDHIGGLPDILDSFPIETLIMPKVGASTKTFENVLDALERNNQTVTTPHEGDQYELGSAVLTILSSSEKEYKDINNSSIIYRIDYGPSSILLTGDAEKEAETDVLGMNLKADILKVGHHGSRYSTTSEFLSEVDPKYALISCGLDNMYGHPHSETIEKLDQAGVVTLRTDQMGTIYIYAYKNGDIIVSEQPYEYKLAG